MCIRDRIWIAVDGMGGDYAPGPILEGCLEAISRFPINIKFVGKIETVNHAAEKAGLADLLENEIQRLIRIAINESNKTYHTF